MDDKEKVVVTEKDEYEVVKYIVAIMLNMEILDEQERDKILREYK